MIAVHPLSGVIDPSAFDLETGRLCVMASRHQAGFIMLTRDHVGETLRNYVPSAEQAPGRPDIVGRGHDAHLRFWTQLEDARQRRRRSPELARPRTPDARRTPRTSVAPGVGVKSRFLQARRRRRSPSARPASMASSLMSTSWRVVVPMSWTNAAADGQPLASAGVGVHLQLERMDLAAGRRLVVDDREVVDDPVVLVVDHVGATADDDAVEIELEGSLRGPGPASGRPGGR